MAVFLRSLPGNVFIHPTNAPAWRSMSIPTSLHPPLSSRCPLLRPIYFLLTFSPPPDFLIFLSLDSASQTPTAPINDPPPYRTLPPDELFPRLPFPLLVLGDLNVHHPSTDPLRTLDPSELSVSHPYFSLASEHDFSLLNQPGVFTYFPITHTSRASVLDLAFANSHLFPAFSRWDTPLPSTGSDHVPILISFCSPRFRPPDPSPNWPKTDWDTILPQLPSLVPPPPTPSCSISVFEEWFEVHSNKIKTLVTSNTPVSRPSPRSKPW